MFALLKNGRLVNLTACSTEVTNALADGTADTVKKVETLDEVAVLVNNRCSHFAVDQDTSEDADGVLSALGQFFDNMRTSIEDGASSLYEQARSLSGKDILTRAEAAFKQARDAGAQKLDELRKVVHKATEKVVHKATEKK